MNAEIVDVEWDGRVAALWAQINELEEEVFRSAHALLVDELPAGSSVATFERAALNAISGRQPSLNSWLPTSRKASPSISTPSDSTFSTPVVQAILPCCA